MGGFKGGQPLHSAIETRLSIVSTGLYTLYTLARIWAWPMWAIGKGFGGSSL